MTERAVIEFQHVSVNYANGVCALREVSFAVVAGEFVFLVGGSGAGKSTALKLMYRELCATEGGVMVAGVDVSGLGLTGVARLRRRLGIVFQDFKLLEQRTVRENLKFAMQVAGTRPWAIAKRVNELLGQVGLAGRNRDFPQQLSSGEQQRLCIARALINNPALLLADEPTGNLDPRTSADIMALLSEINARGTTVVVATHDREVVDAMRRRVIYLEGGQIVADDPCGGYEPPTWCADETIAREELGTAEAAEGGD